MDPEPVPDPNNLVVTVEKATELVANLEGFRVLRGWTLKQYKNVSEYTLRSLQKSGYTGPGLDHMVNLVNAKIREVLLALLISVPDPDSKVDGDFTVIFIIIICSISQVFCNA